MPETGIGFYGYFLFDTGCIMVAGPIMAISGEAESTPLMFPLMSRGYFGWSGGYLHSLVALLIELSFPLCVCSFSSE